MRLRTRVFLLVAGVVALTVTIVIALVSSAARRAFETLDAQRTTAVAGQIQRELARAGEDVAGRLGRLAADDRVRGIAIALAQPKADIASFVNDAAPLAESYGLDLLDIVDDRGSVISSAHWPARFGYPHAWAAVHQPAAGSALGAFLQPIDLAESRVLGLVAIRSVTAGARRVHLAGGRRIDARFVRELPVPADIQALIYRQIDHERSREALLSASGDVAAGALDTIVARVKSSGREAHEAVPGPEGLENVHAAPLTGRDGGVAAVLLVTSSGRELASLVRTIRWTGVTLGSIGILLGFAVSYAIANHVTRPVEQLADGARAVAAGNWDTRVGIRAGGEIGQLAGAFDTMTAQLADQRERLVQAERVAAWRELARRLAHELKNPLFPLRLTVDNLQRAKADHPDQFDEVFEEGVTTLSTGLRNLNTVIGGFSDFAKMPAPERRNVVFNDVVRETLGLVRARLQDPARPRIALVEELDDKAGRICADPEQLSRAVQNLALNAIDAMPEGGTLTVRTRRSGTTAHLEIADTGVGIAEEERQRLFTPYYTTKQHGTGLGLAIVQAIVADHHGTIRVDSVQGGGTTFRIELPAG